WRVAVDRTDAAGIRVSPCWLVDRRIGRVQRGRVVAEGFVRRVVEVQRTGVTLIGAGRHLHLGRFVGGGRSGGVKKQAKAAVHVFVGQDQIGVRLDLLVQAIF